MPSDLLNHVVVEVARVAKKAARNIVGVLQTFIDFCNEWYLRPLSKLDLGVLGRKVQSLDPVVMGSGIGLLHMILEDDDVRARDLLSIR